MISGMKILKILGVFPLDLPKVLGPPKNILLSYGYLLIQLSFTVVGSESQISVDQVTLYSSIVKGNPMTDISWGGEGEW